MNNLVLSIFPGVDLLGRSFEEEGFCVVRGPDLLWGGDIRTFHPPSGPWGGIIGGPPCQSFSKLGVMARNRGQQVGENLIPEFERVVAEAAPAWWLMENVPDAPVPVVADYQGRPYLLNNRWVGGIQRRLRRFTFGTRDGRELDLTAEWQVLEPAELVPTITANGSVWDPVKRQSRGDHNARYLALAIRAQGLPADYRLPAFRVREAVRAVGNGVPLPMGRAVARAIRRAIEASC